ncbi:GNAT family N-acetyltransferase [Patescibacteria group bacterium]|nr:GNAT family N-acetyltransferase [Patescibacteria group bacterium]MBU4017392.1 GNAT family N-acetyltransferase [Patescibacteria group bacterium]MBU4098554.1 GNAT family N-acetyltransferase [Patescibacteria group bacterium]
MNPKVTIQPLTKELFKEAVELVLKAGLDTKEEIEHHLKHIDAHYVALDKDSVIGIIGWYQDDMNYAADAMGDKFPGVEVYWIGFFAVDDKYRGKGIGYALLNKLEKAIKEKGAKELWVSSVPETKNYYQRQGFEMLMQGKIGDNPKIFCVKKIT